MASAKTKARICEAALQLFNARGPAAVSTREIADAAGISEGNLWYHYRRKRDLVMALVGELEAAFAGLRLDLDGGEKPPLRYVAFIDRLMRVLWHYRFALRDEPQTFSGDPTVRARLRALSDTSLEAAESLMRKACTDGLLVLREEQVPRLATNVWLLLRFWYPYYAGRNDATDPEDAMREGLAQVGALVYPHMSPAGQRMAESIARGETSLDPAPAAADRA